MKKRFAKSVVSLFLVMAFVFGIGSGAFITAPVVEAASVSTNVKFTKPAICCNVGDTIDLTKCGVQFSATSTMVTSGITWTKGGSTITSFKPTAKGVTTLVAKSGSTTKNIYVVAKNVDDEEYVLYRNDFDTAPTDFRVIETTNGGSAYHNGATYVVDSGNNPDRYTRVLLPAYLDAFGDAKFEISMLVTDAADTAKWSSMMYRVQSSNAEYMQSCFRNEMKVSNGVEIAQRTNLNTWNVFRTSYFEHYYPGNFNIYSVEAKGTSTVTRINNVEVVSFGNARYATGAWGFQTRGEKLIIDYVKLTLDGNEDTYYSQDVPFSKPAIATDIGQSIDLTKCDVQFTADAVYTSGSSITWKNGSSTITKFTPSSKGVTTLTATAGGKTKNVYVVTRNLTDCEYVLYDNDFSQSSTFGVIKDSASSVYVSNGSLVLDASSSSGSYARANFPSFLNDFGDCKIETSFYDYNAKENWSNSTIIIRAKNNDFPYMGMTVRKDATLSNGAELSYRDENSNWTIMSEVPFSGKANGHNVYTVVAQGNVMKGYINSTQVVSADNALRDSGAIAVMACGLRIDIDWFKVSLGETTMREETGVSCAISKTRPAIGVNAGQTARLTECLVQFVYNEPPVPGDEVVWTKDGKVITEYSDTSEGIHWVTATNGHRTMEVAVVAKKSLGKEYVLYDFGFDYAPTNLRVIEQGKGGSAYYSNGTYVLDASSSNDAYVRVLLPSYLDSFGDITFQAAVKLSNAKSGDKWGSMIYRLQNGDYPYVQNLLRYNATLANGMEISEKILGNDLWDVHQKKSTGLHSANNYNLWCTETHNRTAKFYLNGSKELEDGNVPYYNGGIGFQARGLKLTLDWAKVVFTRNYTYSDLRMVSGNYFQVREPDTGIRISPAIVTEIKTKADLNNILTNNPSVAIMQYDVINGEGKIVLSDGTVEPDTALDKIIGSVIPCFRLDSHDDADSLAAFLRGRLHKDVFVVSTDPAVVKTAYHDWKYARGVVDYSSKTSFDAEALRKEAAASMARIVILPETATKDDITHIQDNFSAVWLKASAGKTASVTAINKGPYGIVTTDRATLEQCYEDYYKTNTLIRRTNVIGHRGNPSNAQENTVAGANTAYSNGATMVETDVYKVADGVLMVMHDETIDRTTNGSGNVYNMTSSQIKQYVVDINSKVATQPVPSLEDFFTAIKSDKSKKLVVEIKHNNTSFAETLANLVNKHGVLDQIVVIAFNPDNLLAIRQYLPGVATGYLNTDLPFAVLEPAHATEWTLELIQNHGSVYNPQYSGINYGHIREITYRGVNYWPWTLDSLEAFDELIINGIGGLTTDYCEWIRDYIEKIYVDANGKVMAQTYSGSIEDVSGLVEMVVVEDTLGISYYNGEVKVPTAAAGGKASYFFRLRSATLTGLPYYTVTEVQTVEVAASPVFELKSTATVTMDDYFLKNIKPTQTVADIKAQFKYPVSVINASGTTLANTAKIPTGAKVCLDYDKNQYVIALVKGDVNGDAAVNSTDYARIKSQFLKQFNITGVYSLAADVDGDGAITGTDYVRLKSYLLGKFNIYS